jgi:hypothetical protein
MNFRKKKNAESNTRNDQQTKGMGLASSLSVYYIFMLLLVSIPLVIFFIVLFLRAVIDYRFYIFSGGAALILLGGFLVYRFRGRFKKKIIKESVDVMEAVRSAAGDGQTVHISILGGLMNVTYEGGDGDHRKALDWNEPARALPAPVNGEYRPVHGGPPAAGHGEIVEHDASLSSELESLYHLKERGLLTDREYESAKKRLLAEKPI